METKPAWENQFLPPQFEDLTPGAAKAAPKAEPQPITAKDTENGVRPFRLDLLLKDSKAKVLKLEAADAARFSSNQFVEEGTLLTNVEEYAKRIRAEADKQARLISKQAELALSEAEETLAHAQVVEAEAKKSAQKMVETAEAAVEEIERAAYEKGYAEGMARGMEQARVDNELATAKVMDLLAELKDLRMALFREHETEIVKQVLLLAKKVVHEELRTQPDFVLNLLKGAIHYLEGQGKVKITLHPVEYDFIAKHQPELAAYLEEGQVINLKRSSDTAPSAPVIETDFAVVELSLARQFEEVDHLLENCLDERRQLFDPRYKAEREAQMGTPT